MEMLNPALTFSLVESATAEAMVVEQQMSQGSMDNLGEKLKSKISRIADWKTTIIVIIENIKFHVILYLQAISHFVFMITFIESRQVQEDISGLWAEEAVLWYLHLLDQLH